MGGTHPPTHASLLREPRKQSSSRPKAIPVREGQTKFRGIEQSPPQIFDFGAKIWFRAGREIWAKIKIGRESLLSIPSPFSRISLPATTPSPPDPLCCHLRRRSIPPDSGEFSRRRPPPPRTFPDSMAWNRRIAAPPQTLAQDSGFTEEQELPTAAADSVKLAQDLEGRRWRDFCPADAANSSRTRRRGPPPGQI